MRCAQSRSLASSSGPRAVHKGQAVSRPDAQQPRCKSRARPGLEAAVAGSSTTLRALDRDDFAVSSIEDLQERQGSGAQSSWDDPSIDASEVTDFGWGVEDLEEDEEDTEEEGVEISESVEVRPSKRLERQRRPSSTGREAPGGQQASDRERRWEESAAMGTLPDHVLRELRQFQTEADEANEDIKKAKKGESQSEDKVHKRLRVINGSFAGRKLLSGKGELTRPMMEKVRAAVFDMLQARCGTTPVLPSDATWLDLFAGTGSVGIEALSRGAQNCCFVELDRWVVDRVLLPNLGSCQIVDRSLVHTMGAEEYLSRARATPEYYTPFDFISVCPPYLKVSYEELFELLEGSPLIHAETHIVVEYPRKSKASIPKSLGPLALIKSRKFGRTHLAVFGPQ